MKKTIIYICGILLLIGIIYSCVRNFDESDKISATTPLTLVEAKSAFEEQLSKSITTRSLDELSKSTLLPGHFTPPWEKALEDNDKNGSSMTIPIKGTHCFVAKPSAASGDEHERRGLSKPVLAFQNIVVVKGYEAQKTNVYLETVIPQSEIFTRPMRAEDAYYAKNFFTGVRVWHSLDGFLVGIRVFDNGKMVVRAFFRDADFHEKVELACRYFDFELYRFDTPAEVATRSGDEYGFGGGDGGGWGGGWTGGSSVGCMTYGCSYQGCVVGSICKGKEYLDPVVVPGYGPCTNCGCPKSCCSNCQNNCNDFYRCNVAECKHSDCMYKIVCPACKMYDCKCCLNCGKPFCTDPHLDPDPPVGGGGSNPPTSPDPPAVTTTTVTKALPKMGKQKGQTCATNCMSFINKFFGGKKSVSKFNNDYDKKYNARISRDGMDMNNLNAFLNDNFQTTNFISYESAVNNNYLVLVSIKTSESITIDLEAGTKTITNSLHVLVVTGYQSDGKLVTMDPGTGSVRTINQTEVVPKSINVITGIK